jgi:hypothetical protein
MSGLSYSICGFLDKEKEIPGIVFIRNIKPEIVFIGPPAFVIG